MHSSLGERACLAGTREGCPLIQTIAVTLCGILGVRWHWTVYLQDAQWPDRLNSPRSPPTRDISGSHEDEASVTLMTAIQVCFTPTPPPPNLEIMNCSERLGDSNLYPGQIHFSAQPSA